MCELVAPYKVRCVKDVPAEAFIAAFSQHLKTQGKVHVPEWTEYVKTGVSRELSPYSADWFYVRMAAIARRVYVNPNVGVGAFKKIFGTKQRNGGGHNRASLASGKIIRVAIQQLEKLGLLEESKTSKGGRIVSSKGRHEMDFVAVHAAAPIAAKNKQTILSAAVNADDE